MGNEVYVQCSLCKGQMSIDAMVCPHCGKSTGFVYSHAYCGIILGVIASIVYSYFFMLHGTSTLTENICLGACICNPMVWLCTFIGAIGGAIVGIIRKEAIKRNLQ